MRDVNTHPMVVTLNKYSGYYRGVLIQLNVDIPTYRTNMHWVHTAIDKVKRTIVRNRREGERMALELQIQLSHLIKVTAE
jgi:hypothetical protein